MFLHNALSVAATSALERTLLVSCFQARQDHEIVNKVCSAATPVCGMVTISARIGSGTCSWLSTAVF
jgi:hypothetical protein